MLSFKVNNNRELILTQPEQYGEVDVYTANNSEKSEDYNYSIPAGDFVMLLNYYRHIKDNNIYNDFINPCGLTF